MALTRRLLKSMGIEDEKIDQIIEAHSETVTALKGERDQFKEDAEKLAEVQEELDKLKSAPGDGFKEKYEAEHAEFAAYKEQVEHEREHESKARAYRTLLQEVGVDPKRIDAVMKVADVDSLEMKDGDLEDREGVSEKVKSEWSDFIVQTSTKPATVPNPPASVGGDTEPRNLTEALRQRYLK